MLRGHWKLIILQLDPDTTHIRKEGLPHGPLDTVFLELFLRSPRDGPLRARHSTEPFWAKQRNDRPFHFCEGECPGCCVRGWYVESQNRPDAEEYREYASPDYVHSASTIGRVHPAESRIGAVARRHRIY